MSYDVWYAIPSASVERATACFAKWKGMGYHTAALVDGDAPAAENADVIVRVPEWPGYYKSVRLLAHHLRDRALGAQMWGFTEPEPDIIVTGGDDMDPDPTCDAQSIATEFFGRFPDGFGVMQPTGDNLPGTDRICGSPWFGRGWLERSYGGEGPHHCGYHVWYGDEELHHVAQKLGVLWQRPDLTQYHRHWMRHRKFGARAKTDYQRRNDGCWGDDKAIYLARREADWPGHEPLEATA